MSKIQKIVCIVLGIVLLGLVASMTKPFQNAKNALFGSSSDNLTTYLMNTTSESKTFDSTLCRTQDGVLVALLCNHIISREKQTAVIQEVSNFKLIWGGGSGTDSCYVNATNLTGFSARGSGNNDYGNYWFGGYKRMTAFWTRSKASPYTSFSWVFDCQNSAVIMMDLLLNNGNSIRCIHD